MLFNWGKIGFDPGHYEGANVDPRCPWYSEGTTMLQLGKMLQDELGTFLTRTDGKDISLAMRAYKAAKAGCNTLISLHSNYPQDGVIVFYSLLRPGDKPMAELIGSEIAKALDIEFRGAKTRASIHSTPEHPRDYYGIIRNGVAQGIEHVFIVEHGSHRQLAYDTNAKLRKIVEAYVRILKGGERMFLKRGMRGEDVKCLQENLNRLGFDCGKVDGIFGPKTQNAVKMFQLKYNLEVDGIAGPKTLAKIEELLEKDDKDKKIEELQKKINELESELEMYRLYKIQAQERGEKIEKIKEILGVK